jgi:hypothetical protein
MRASEPWLLAVAVAGLLAALAIVVLITLGWL